MSRKKIDNSISLSAEQALALELLQSGENIFLTGGAGSGKSFLIRHFMSGLDPKTFPILASTGAAAVLIGGRTFHSFFGLGILEGGMEATLERCLSDRRLRKRLKEIEGFILDEVSMIPGQALSAAETLAREFRESSLPWGGLRVIVVGDFAQLPPVSRNSEKDWAFLSDVWQRSGFQPCVLSHNQRVRDNHFLDILADVRRGEVTDRVRKLLDSCLQEHNENDTATRLFPLRVQSENFNKRQLEQIESPEVQIPSIYLGEERFVESLKKNSPVPPVLSLKVGARVLFVQNDPQRRWINGTRGTIIEISPEKILVEKDRGRDVGVEKTSFSLLDAEGKMRASVINFPLTLAYATTIHKSQGATLENMWVDLSRLWEPGQAYVALSRLPDPGGLRLLGWSPNSIRVDPRVVRFYSSLAGGANAKFE